VTDASPIADELFLSLDRLQRLLDGLRADGFSVLAPTVDQGAITYGEIQSLAELPRGWTDRQEAATYRLERREDEALFGYVVGPQSWKKFLFPPLSVLLTATAGEDGWTFRAPEEQPPRQALLGVRACELAAIAMQDRVFLGSGYVDPVYAARRRNLLLIAVNCTQAAPTCFCTSMRTGPRCAAGYDLALTEIAADDPSRHGFTVEVGSDAGRSLMERLGLSSAADEQSAAAEAGRQAAVDQIARRMETDGLRDLLLGNLEHPRWQETAQRCLSCTNCTMVCPTCFCSTVSEVSDLTGEQVERRRQWDSCFNPDFSYVHGGLIRDDIRSRYRQWLTHKLASWHDQFGTSGCVGCGRCITWCPVGIDLTQEVAAIRGEPA